jgi:hypothetical protein
MLFRLRCDLDPLDREILEKALGSLRDGLKQNGCPVELDSDEALEAALRRELIEMIRSSGVSNPEALLDILVADLSDRGSEPQVQATERQAPCSPPGRAVILRAQSEQLWQGPTLHKQCPKSLPRL